MKVIIVGGTGFLGYHATLDLLKRGHQVSILALPPLPAAGLFPHDVTIQLSNLADMADEEVLSMLSGQDVLIFAAGADDRVLPNAPAYPFFFKHNVQPVQRLAGICRLAGVKKLVILGSYFAYFHRLWPSFKLTDHHPYIRSRVEQTRLGIEAGGSELAVITLELPYIFGTMPGRIPLWNPLVVYAASRFPLFYPRGGTTCVTVWQVGQAITGAVERGEAGRCYPIGGENLTWVELLGRISRFSGREKKIITLPNWMVSAGALIIKKVHQKQGKEGGLDPVQFIKLQTAETYIDPNLSQPTLGYDSGGLDEALKETVRACLSS